MATSRGALRRELGLPALAVYGIGGMLGGGIYALIGEVAGEAGAASGFSFLLAMAVVAPTAWTYARLAAAHPHSGGESTFARRAFGGELVPFVVGWCVLFSGLVSMATLARAFAGYARDLVPASPTWVLVPAFLGALAVLNLRGIRVASTANILCTLVEAAGLVLVLLAATVFLWGDAPAPPIVPPPAHASPAGWGGVLPGAALAFYAFIGFEDMVNVAEEVRRPERAYPVAIPVALVSVGLLYAAVSFLATRVVPPSELAASDAPLARVVERAWPGFPIAAFAVIALFAVANSALLNFVMASRLVYGMAREGLLTEWIGHVHPRFRTPHRAIVALLATTVAIAASGDIGQLAGATSLLLLAVFFTVNMAHLALGRRGESEPAASRLAMAIPLTGMGLSAGLVAFLPGHSLVLGGALLALGVVLGGLRRAVVGPRPRDGD